MIADDRYHITEVLTNLSMHTYQGIALYGENGDKRAAVEIIIKAHSLEFRLDDELHSWSFQGLHFESGGNNGNLIYVKHPSESGLTLYTREKRLAKDPHISAHRHLGNSAKQIRMRDGKRYSLYIGFLLVCVGCIAALFSTRSYVVKQMANAVPVEWEETVGDQLLNTIAGHYDIHKEKEDQAFLDSVFRPLTTAIGDTVRSYQFYICDDASLNAFALPGGHVVINQGLLNAVESSEELFGVVAHELAHVNERHHIRGMINNVVILVFFHQLAGNDAGLTGVFGETSRQLGSMAFSRSFELEADRVGADYLRRANIDPQGFIDFFYRIEEEQQKQQEALNETLDTLMDVAYRERDVVQEEEDSSVGGIEVVERYFSTHPPIEERIIKLSTQFEAHGAYRTLMPIDSIRAHF